MTGEILTHIYLAHTHTYTPSFFVFFGGGGSVPFCAGKIAPQTANNCESVLEKLKIFAKKMHLFGSK